MARIAEENVEGSEERSRCKDFITQVILRILAFLVTLVATMLMALNKQTSELAGYPLEASYKLSSALKFFVVGNAVVCGYSMLSLLLISKILKCWLLRLLDLMIMGLVMAAASAATAIGYLGKKGNNDIGWCEVCSYYNKFCNKVGISVSFSYFGFLLFFLICALSSTHKTDGV